VLPFTRKKTAEPSPISSTENRIPYNFRLLNKSLNIIIFDSKQTFSNMTKKGGSAVNAIKSKASAKTEEANFPNV
jgi:hypothetical protein